MCTRAQREANSQSKFENGGAQSKEVWIGFSFGCSFGFEFGFSSG